MDYEQYYQEALACHKGMKEKAKAQSKTLGRISKSLGDGDLDALPKMFASLRETARDHEEALISLESLTEGFNGKEYMSSGDFAVQMLECCNNLGVDVQGTFPVYEMFPCKVTINVESQEVTVDNKRLRCLRPFKLISDIKAVQESLAKVQFNAQAFAKELAAAYDLELLRKAKGKAYAPDKPCYLLDLYNILTPMRRYKKDYDKQSYAFDLARLYSSEEKTLDDKRAIRFDTARENKKAIRILDGNGMEQYITTIRFYK